MSIYEDVMRAADALAAIDEVDIDVTIIGQPQMLRVRIRVAYGPWSYEVDATRPDDLVFACYHVAVISNVHVSEKIRTLHDMWELLLKNHGVPV